MFSLVKSVWALVAVKYKNRWADENSSMNSPFSTKFILLLKSLTEIYFIKVVVNDPQNWSPHLNWECAEK